MTLFGGGRRREGGLGAIGAIVGIAALILAPIGAALLQMSLSRRREYLADASAAEITGDPEGLASALAKLRDDHHPLKKVTRATAHLYIESPLRDHAGLRSSIGGLFDTHPPLEERIRRLEEVGGFQLAGAAGVGRGRGARSTAYVGRQGLRSSTTACAAAPSPRPAKPRPSPVVPRTETCSARAPHRRGQRARIASTCGARLRRGEHDHAVGVDEPPAEGGDALVGLPQQVERRARRGLVGVREGAADVAQRQRAERRVDQGVADDVGVGVAVQPARVRDLDAAQHQRAPGHQAVGVEGDADAALRLSQAAPRCARGARKRLMVV